MENEATDFIKSILQDRLNTHDSDIKSIRENNIRLELRIEDLDSKQNVIYDKLDNVLESINTYQNTQKLDSVNISRNMRILIIISTLVPILANILHGIH